MKKSNKRFPLKTIHLSTSIIGVIITEIVWWFILSTGDLAPYIYFILILSPPFGFLAGFIGYRMEMLFNPKLQFNISCRFILLTIILSAIFSFAGIFLILLAMR